MVTGPEPSHLIAGYEPMSGVKEVAISSKHHEQTLSAQRSFLEKAEALHTMLKEMDNPFQEDSADLLVLVTKNRRSSPCWAGWDTSTERPGAVSVIHGGHGEWSTFYKPIKRNKVAFFRHEQAASSSKKKVLKDDCQLFSRLFISCQTRQCDKNSSSMRISPPLPLLVTGKFGARFTLT